MIIFWVAVAVIIVISIVIGKAAGFELRLPLALRKIFHRH